MSGKRERFFVAPLLRMTAWRSIPRESSGVGLVSEVPHQCLVQSDSDIFGERDWLSLAVDFDGLAGGIYDQSTVFAARQVDFQIAQHHHVEIALEITGKFANHAFAVHVVALRRK